MGGEEGLVSYVCMYVCEEVREWEGGRNANEEGVSELK